MSPTTSSTKKKSHVAVQLDDRSEFIPYHSHYNPHTLLTKNGELMQVIKIEGNLAGQPCENLDGVHASICDVIRHVISGSEVTAKFSFWLHTIRRRNDMPYAPVKIDGQKSEDFTSYVGTRWQEYSQWRDVYKNEVFLTIIYEGQNIPLVSSKQFSDLVFPEANRKARNKYLDSSYRVLEKFTGSVLEGLKTQCSARRIGLAERVMHDSGKINRPPVFYSEILEFLGTIYNLNTEPFPLPDMDLSVAVQKAKIAFGFNAIEARNKETGKRRYGAMLTLKQYVDTQIADVDCVLQAPIELIISQSFSFIPAVKALKHYKAQKAFFEVSGDAKSKDAFGINQMFAADDKSPVDFGEQQTSFMVMVDDLRRLDEEVGKFIRLFSRLGLLTVREDIMTEESFLSQLPANFEFIRRKTPMATGQIGGFCRLNRFDLGKATGNHWGDCLAVLPTSVNSPYFFNFHVGDNGHTVFFDFNSFEDRTAKILEYFLLTRAVSKGARMIVFDRNQSARMLFSKLGKKYFAMTHLNKINRDLIEDKAPRLFLNPFLLEESNRNISFLVSWCGLLISQDSLIDEQMKAVLREAISGLYTLPESERNLPNMVALLARINADLAKLFEPWVGRGKNSGLFDSETDRLDMGSDDIGFDMTAAVANHAFMIPLFSYLMHRIISSLDGTPTVIVINEAWDLLENAFFAPRLESLLEMLRERNVMVMFTTSHPTQCRETATLATINTCCASKIYLPDELPLAYHEQDIGLNEDDTLELLHMHRQRGDFLLKQKEESVSLRLSLKDEEDITAIFTNDIKAISLARGKFTGLPEVY